MSQTPRHGRWSERGVPHRNWLCVNVEDLGEPLAICEMCESQTIRYVHHMFHPRYEEELAVGSVCASNMEEDSQAAGQRERGVRNTSRRRQKWLTRKWRVSAKGNSYLNTDGYNIVIFRRGLGWAVRFTHRETERATTLPRLSATEDAAKLAAFDVLMAALARRSS